MAFKMKPGRGNFPKTGHGTPLNMINEGPGDDTKNKKKSASDKKEEGLQSVIVNKLQKKSASDEKIAKDVTMEINKRFPDRPQPEGIDLGKFSNFVKRGKNIIEREGVQAVYTAAKGVGREQFENYVSQLKKKNPEAAKKIQFKYNW